MENNIFQVEDTFLISDELKHRMVDLEGKGTNSDDVFSFEVNKQKFPCKLIKVKKKKERFIYQFQMGPNDHEKIMESFLIGAAIDIKMNFFNRKELLYRIDSWSFRWQTGILKMVID